MDPVYYMNRLWPRPIECYDTSMALYIHVQRDLKFYFVLKQSHFSTLIWILNEPRKNTGNRHMGNGKLISIDGILKLHDIAYNNYGLTKDIKVQAMQVSAVQRFNVQMELLPAIYLPYWSGRAA